MWVAIHPKELFFASKWTIFESLTFEHVQIRTKEIMNIPMILNRCLYSLSFKNSYLMPSLLNCNSHEYHLTMIT